MEVEIGLGDNLLQVKVLNGHPTSMASAAASALWPSSMDCSAPTRLRKAGALMTLFTDSARPMWRWILGSAFSWDANSFSSVRLLSAACAHHHDNCLLITQQF